MINEIYCELCKYFLCISNIMTKIEIIQYNWIEKYYIHDTNSSSYKKDTKIEL